ncbi:efflux RND transporter periplasmic adaptor subunit [bacterium]|nr:efflux RND transporter periplasmic adaptor subunit [bacterium]
MKARGIRVSPGLLTFIVGLLLLAVSGVIYQQYLMSTGRLSAGPANAQPAAGAPTKYACPMRCVETDEPGSCPVCGMDMQPVESSVQPAASTAPTAATAELYTCPMHPQIVQDHTGSCPICGMELVPKQDDSGALDSSLAEAVDTVRLSPTQALLSGVEAVHPSREHKALSIPAFGETVIPEGQIESISSWTEGRIDDLFLRDTGGKVSKGDHILDLYSEELVQAQEEFLVAKAAVDQLAGSGYENISQSSRSLLESSRTKLQRLGMTAEQIKNLEESGRVADRIPIYSGKSGVVMEKKVDEGMYVMKGESLYEVADLSKLWVEVQVFEADAAKLRVGDKVVLASPSQPGKTYRGKVILIEPEVSMETRTWTARVEVSNPDMSLRPGQVLNATLSFDYGELLLLPRNAVLHTGDGDLVYVLAGENTWRPRRVTVGRDFGDMVEIVDGLSAEEAVAGTAVFLLDSEAQLKGVPRPVDTAAGSKPNG